MPTVINNPSGSDEGSGMGLIFGAVVAIVFLVLFFVYILPAINNKQPGSNVKIEVPAPSVGQ